jgi:hypothetical protein
MGTTCGSNQLTGTARHKYERARAPTRPQRHVLAPSSPLRKAHEHVSRINVPRSALASGDLAQRDR